MDTWSDLCRCCLSSNSTVSIFDTNQNVKVKFQEITSIEVKPDDGLPQKLCDTCFTIMNNAYQFRKQCIKMDTDLKEQLNALINQAKEAAQLQSNDNELDDSIRKLDYLIKTEPNDSDDDCYYVLVIDDPKEKEKNTSETETVINEPKLNFSNVKMEINECPVTPEPHIEDPSSPVEDFQEHSQHPFENTIDSFLVSNTKVPVNVPATILENEEESQENEDHFNNVMDVDTQNESSQGEVLPPLQQNPDSEDKNDKFPDNIIDTKNLIKILTSSEGDGTIVLKDSDGVEYLTNTLVSGADGEQLDQEEEVIFCEGGASQFQVLKCEGSELVIEYVDDGQIATVLQQEDGTFLCDCGEQFEDLSEYEKHQYKHNPAGDFLCNLCGKGFETSEILAGHTLLHSVTGLLVNCPFCTQTVRRKALTQHIKHFHNNKPTCNVCFKTFANPNNLKRHMMIHSGIKEFECDMCPKRFHQKITMQTHRLTHINPYSCNQCDETFEHKNALSAHKERGECTKSKVLKVKEELMKAVKQEVTTTVGKLLGYACSLCRKMFSVESALEQHIESTHIVDPMDLLCPECGAVMPSKKDMATHLTTHKIAKSKNAKRFECSVCGKGCSSQAMLIMHERVHTNERPFPCQLCSLRFKTKTHLRTHQLTHTREKKFGCSVCMKFFALKGNLVVHLRTHTGERPYICSICGDAFIDSKYLKKHKFKKHSIDNVPWNKY